MPNSAGFSIVELIVVIVLIGVAGAVIVPRFLGPDAFDEIAAHDSLIAGIRSAQQAALGREDVAFEIGSGGGNWIFTAATGSTILRTFEVPASGVKLETGSPVASSDTCASGTDFNTAVSGFKLTFDGLGNLASFANAGVAGSPVDTGGTFNGVRICVNDTVETSVCVSPGGYAYPGTCDD